MIDRLDVVFIRDVHHKLFAAQNVARRVLQRSVRMLAAREHDHRRIIVHDVEEAEGRRIDDSIRINGSDERDRPRHDAADQDFVIVMNTLPAYRNNHGYPPSRTPPL
ncbi:hypothetical protein D3C71_1950870 [compost metagenome]